MIGLAHAFVVTALMFGAAAAQAAPCAGFTDVEDTSGFCSSIAWMKNRAITLGCTATEYCPDAFVRRDHMAAFLYRLGFQNAFLNGGSAFGTTAVLGTTDNQALELRASGAAVMRYEPRAISPNLVGGSPANEVVSGVRGATIAGGGLPDGDTDPDFIEEGPNRVTDAFGIVGGGFANVAGDDAGSTVDRPYATVGGGKRNRAQGRWATVAGGGANVASGTYATVGGGYHNLASGEGATVGGGGFTGCGEGCEVFFNNIAAGNWSTVPGGTGNVAAGTVSFAAGFRAKANHNGAFVWSDQSPADFESLANDTFNIRATGGVRIVTDVDAQGSDTWTCALVAGGGWNCSSDRRLKQALVLLDGEAVLDRLVAMPVYQWQPKGRNAHVMHYGPMAQDFRAAFGLGIDETTIGMQDADGVALAAIQGLNAKLQAQASARDAEMAMLKREIAELRQAVEVLLDRAATDSRTADAR